MTFALHTPPLAPTDPSYQMVADFQTKYDALSAPVNAALHTMLVRWGWRQTANPAAYWRLFARGLVYARTLP